MIRKVLRNRKLQVLLKQTPAYGLWQQLTYADWKRKGKPIPPPNVVKQRLVKDYARGRGISTLVETGTYYGDMVYACRNTFTEIHSVELDETLYSAAQMRFDSYSHIHLHLGDSGKVINDILDQLDETAVFWLDAHYMAIDNLVRGPQDSPIVKELEAIFNHHIKEHVILIDDARDFTGKGGYIQLPSLKLWIEEEKPDFVFEIQDDIIRIHS